MQQFAWAIVDRKRLAVFNAQAQIFWRRYIAQHECNRRNGTRQHFHVVKVTINEVHKPR